MASVIPRAGVVVLVLAVLAVGVWLGTRWGSGPEVATGPAAATTGADPPAGSASPTSASPAAGEPSTEPVRWNQVLVELYARRATAFTTADVAVLDGVYTADSPLRAADEGAITRLAAAGEVLRGFAPRVVAVTSVDPTGAEVRVELTDRWPDYAVVPADRPGAKDGRTEQGRGETRVRIVLARTAGGWRIAGAERLD